jgi:RHS repeat-associated protein
MLTAAKEGTFSVSRDPYVFFPLAASVPNSGVYSKTRVRGSKPKNVHCSSAIGPLRIELRWGYANSSEKTAAGSGVTFKYDPFGRRIYKSSSSGTSIYAYDLDNLIEEANSSGAAVARYTQGTMIDEPLVILRGGATSYYEADGLGTITSLSNTSGALAQTYTFDSFGKQTASSGSLINSFQYAGREFDGETTLYYMRARYFDPTTGRFLNEDPVRFLGGSNFYRYAINNPTGFIDPFGWCPPTRNQRLKAAAQGLGNILLGSVKVAGGLALTAETGGLAAPVGFYAIGNGFVENIAGGISQLAGAATGNLEEGEKGAQAASAAGTISGLVTLAVTKGNVCRAAQAASVEGVALSPFLVGLGPSAGPASHIEPGDAVDTVQNAWELVTGKGCEPPKPKKCEQSCQQ